jgi:hypothetical protein
MEHRTLIEWLEIMQRREAEYESMQCTMGEYADAQASVAYALLNLVKSMSDVSDVTVRQIILGHELGMTLHG